MFCSWFTCSTVAKTNGFPALISSLCHLAAVFGGLARHNFTQQIFTRRKEDISQLRNAATFQCFSRALLCRFSFDQRNGSFFHITSGFGKRLCTLVMQLQIKQQSLLTLYDLGERIGISSVWSKF